MNLLSIFYKKDNMRNHVRNEKNRASPEIVSVLQFRAIYRQAMRPHLIIIAGKRSHIYPFSRVVQSKQIVCIIKYTNTIQ